MSKTSSIKCAIAVIIASVCASAPAFAASVKEFKMGVVDVQRVMDNAPRMKKYAEELKAYEQLLNKKLNLRMQYALLSSDELNELIELKTKSDATSTDKARIKVLVDIESAKDSEMRTLEQTKNLTDQQKNRLKELQTLRQSSKKNTDSTDEDYFKQLQSKGQEQSEKAKSELNIAINKVAENKGLSIVVAKQAIRPEGSSTVVLLGGVDVTDDVIARLDR